MRSLVLVVTSVLAAFAAASGSAQSLTLSPAAVPLRGLPGQSTTQSLTLGNGTSLDLDFALEAKDVVVRDGRRVFVDAGETVPSIAETAVFSSRRLTVPAGESRTVQVTLTLPPGASHRAVVALFRGLTRVGNTLPSVGTLLTFTLSGEFVLTPSDLLVDPQSATANLAFEELLANDGKEPLVPKGVAVLLDKAGAIVGKAAFPTRRLLPGERQAVRAEYAGELPPGGYRVLATFEYEGRALTRAAEFQVP